MSNSRYNSSRPSDGPPPVTASDPQSFAYVLPVDPALCLHAHSSSNQTAIPYHNPVYQYGTQADPPMFPEDLGDVAETTPANPAHYQSPSSRNIERPTNTQRWSPYPTSPASRNARAHTNAAVPISAYSPSRLNVPSHHSPRRSPGARPATKSLSPLSQPPQYPPLETAPAMSSGQQFEHIMGSDAQESSKMLGDTASVDPAMLQANHSAGQTYHTPTITFRDPFSPRPATGTLQEEGSHNDSPALSSRSPYFAHGRSPAMSQATVGGHQPQARQNQRIHRHIVSLADRNFRAYMKNYPAQAKALNTPYPPPADVVAGFQVRAYNMARHQTAQQLAAQRQVQKQGKLQPSAKLGSAARVSTSPLAVAAPHQDGEDSQTMLLSSQPVSFESLLEYDQAGNDQIDYNDQSNRREESPIQIEEDPSGSGPLIDNSTIFAPPVQPAPRAMSDAETRLQKLKSGLFSSIITANHAYDQRAANPDRFQFRYAELQLGVEQAMFNYIAAYTAFDQLYIRMWTTTDDELLEVVEYVSRRLKSNIAQLDSGVRRRLDGIADLEFKWTAISKSLAMFYDSFSSLKAGLMQRDKKRGDGQKTFVEALGVERCEVWDAIRPGSDEDLDGSLTEEMAVHQQAVQEAVLRPREFEYVTAELLQDSVRALEGQERQEE